MSFYQEQITEELVRHGRVAVDPRHVEAWMRLKHPTFDHLSRDAFTEEVAAALECLDVAGSERSECLGRSVGI